MAGSESSDSGKAFVDKLPLEVQMRIFSPIATVSDVRLNMAYGWGLTPPWREAVRNARALTMVSRSWRNLCLPYLYSTIVFNSLTQLPAFVAALRSKPLVLCPLIDRIVIRVLFPIGATRLVQQYLDEIVARCPRLRSLHITIPQFSSSKMPNWERWIFRASSQVSDLHIDACTGKNLEVDNGRLLKAIAQTTHLVSLTLSLPRDSELPPDPIALELPALCELQLFIQSEYNASMLADIARYMSVPVLRALTICLVPVCRTGQGINDDFDDVRRHIYIIISHLSHELRYLHLADYFGDAKFSESNDWYDTEWTMWPTEVYQSYVEHCPRLEHFVAPLPPGETQFSLSCSAALRWVDAWVPPFAIEGVKDVCVDLVRHDGEDDAGVRRRYPALLGCRHLDSSLNIFVDLPTIFHPRSPSDSSNDTPTLWTVGGYVGVVETSQYVAAATGITHASDLENADDGFNFDNDSDYLPSSTSEDEDGSSDGWTGEEELEDLDGRKESDPGNWVVKHEHIIADYFQEASLPRAC